MGKLQDDIQELISASYGRGIDGKKIAKRLIEAGLTMMDEEGDLSPESRVVPIFDKYQDFDTFHIAKRVELTAPFATSEMAEVIEIAGQQFLFYAFQHNEKGTPASALKAEVNVRLADMCFNAIGATTQRRPVQLAAGVPVSAHFPHAAGISGGGIPADVLENAAREPQESVSKARSSDGTPALSVAPSRSEIVAWVMSKADKAKKEGDEHVFFVLQAIAGELEQHLEERQVNVAYALREFYADCHARNVKAGWWTDLATGIAKKRSVGELFMLFVTEIEEAYRAYVEGSQDDKLPQYPGLGVELGDLQIRLADFAGAMLAGSLVSHDPDVSNPGDQMFQEVCEIARRYEAIRKTDAAVGDPETGDFIPATDVGEMVVAKLEFNANRADHKIENRMKEDGKRT
jgi:hypothetical protein